MYNHQGIIVISLYEIVNNIYRLLLHAACCESLIPVGKTSHIETTSALKVRRMF
jgi:hypothetical protein